MRGLVLFFALLLITALGLSGEFLPFRKCPSCDGFVIGTPPRPVQPLNCPDCRDRGTVSLFRSWRPRVSQPIREILGYLNREQAPLAFDRLARMVLDDGKDPEAFLAGSAILLDQRFLEADGKIYLAMILQTFHKQPNISGRAGLLLGADGRALDRVLVSTDGQNASLNAGFLNRASEKDTCVGFGWEVARWPEAMKTCRVEQWQRPAHELPGGNPYNPMIQLAIRGDRFNVLTPEVRR